MGSPTVRAPTTDASRKAALRPHFPCFDGLRTIAVSSAILQHVSFATGAAFFASYRDLVAHFELGPTLFFMISGFLLYRTFVAANFADRPMQPLGVFFRRRILRIFPGYWVALGIILVLHFVRGNHGFGTLEVDGAADVFRLATLTHIYSTESFFHGITQAWTLGTELSFYVFLPLYAFCLRLLTKDRDADDRLRIELLGVVALYVLGVAWRCWVYYGAGLPPIAEYWLPGFFDVFGLGMGLAAISAWTARREETPSWVHTVGRHAELGVLVAVAAFLVMAFWLDLPAGTTKPASMHALARNGLNGVTAFFLVVPAVFGRQDRGPFRRLLQWRPIAYMGLVSFGVYLYHEAWISQAREWIGYPLFAHGDYLATLTICVSWALLCATVSYRLVERPFLELKDRPLRSLWPNPWRPM